MVGVVNALPNTVVKEPHLDRICLGKGLKEVRALILGAWGESGECSQSGAHLAGRARRRP